MSTTDIIAVTTELKELQRLEEELQSEIETAKDKLKAVLEAQGVDTLVAGPFKISYKPVTSRRFDSKAFKAKFGELYEQYSKESVTRRFLVS